MLNFAVNMRIEKFILLLIFCFKYNDILFVSTFELLPYVQIDYLHYIRLAQCQTKCAETYGFVDEKILLDGSVKFYQNITSEYYEICEVGCNAHSRNSLASNINRTNSTSNNDNSDDMLIEALQNGQKFWWESKVSSSMPNNDQNILSSEEINSSIVERIRVLCIERQHPKTQINLDLDEYSINDLDSSYQYNRVRKIKRSAEEAFRFSFSSLQQEITYATPSSKYRSTNRPRNVAAHLMLDTYDALITADLKSSILKLRTKGIEKFNEKQMISENNTVNIRFVILWRQKQKLSIGKIIESNSTKNQVFDNIDNKMTSWITASIESSNTFKVKSIQPDMVYRFMIVPISTNGIVDQPIKSDWIDFQQMLQIQKSEHKTAALSFFSFYNHVDNVGSVIRWVNFDQIFRSNFHSSLTIDSFRNNEIKTDARLQQKPLLFEGCHMEVEYSNKTNKIIEIFTLDESDGFVLRKLAYNSEYTVKISPRKFINNPTLMRRANNDFISSLKNKDDSLVGSFLSLSCSQIFGQGSLECDPEPVQNLYVTVNRNNATVTVSWNSIVEAHFILLYQLFYVSVTKIPECAVPSHTMFLPANTTYAQFLVPKISTECDFELKLVNYDLLGREATATKIFTINFLPEKLWLDDNNVVKIKRLFKQNQFIFIAIIVFVGLAIPILIIFSVMKICTLCRWKNRPLSLYANENVCTNNFEKLLTHDV